MTFYDTFCIDNAQSVLFGFSYTVEMPKLWDKTIEAHRREVREAILEATAALVAQHGPHSVTMSLIAETAGIGRATLYKYFPGTEAILLAWHERQITMHFDWLSEVRDQGGSAGERLEAVLKAYAHIHQERIRHHRAESHDNHLFAFLHRDEQLAAPQQRLHELIRDLLIEAAASGEVRTDIAPDELAVYCLHALTAASSLPSKAAVQRLVAIIRAGLLPDQ